MELFSELYGIYYRLLAKQLKAMPLSESEIRQMVIAEGMPESTLHFLPQLLEQKAWPLFNEKNGNFISKLANIPDMPLTKLEKTWLKAILQDKRAKLFLSEPELCLLSEKLGAEPPLYRKNDFSCFDCCLDGDAYDEPRYQDIFRQILAALQIKKPLKINFTSGKGKKSYGQYVPLKLEYSEKDDKFRVYCAQIRPGKSYNYAIINLARITRISPSAELCTQAFELESWFEKKRVKKPLVVEITNERNALERFMVEFSAYEKSSEFDEATGKCIAQIYYQQYDETEILIKVLSFGPTIKVISPTTFVEQIKQRVQKQMNLLQ